MTGKDLEGFVIVLLSFIFFVVVVALKKTCLKQILAKVLRNFSANSLARSEFLFFKLVVSADQRSNQNSSRLSFTNLCPSVSTSFVLLVNIARAPSKNPTNDIFLHINFFKNPELAFPFINFTIGEVPSEALTK